MRRPITDTREYRHITLGNKLEALLISDASADKSAAAMDVRVGSLFDPPQLQGLAHFLEHMLFLGTDKYPSEDEYQSYLARHGGMSNAFTADNHTCYFFNIAPEHLEGALDRFGQFFISPLFTQNATDREINAVHSEHSKNVQEDMWRQYQLMRTICFDPQHPAHHFSTGNKETLGDIPRSALLNFHKAWYSANVSRLAVLGKDSLEDLESMVRRIFSDVPNKDVVVPLGTGFSKDQFKDAIKAVVDGGVDTSKLEFVESNKDLLQVPFQNDGGLPIINASCIGKNLTLVPVKEQRSLQFCWFLPEQRRLWESKPSRYLSHVLGHEGPGSLTSVLKGKGIATDLVGGLFYDNVGVSLLKVEVHLTKSATDQLATPGTSRDELLAEISQSVAAYINLARRGVSFDIWKEMEVVENLNFQFQPTMDPMTTVQTSVNAMHYFPVQEVLAGPKMIYNFDQDAIQAHLDQLESGKLFTTTVGKEFSLECDQTEKWYGTKFGLQQISELVVDQFARIEQMSDNELESVCESLGLALPKKNQFLPENLTLVEPGADAKVPERSGGSSFFKQDCQFKMPKAHAAFAVYSPYVQSGLKEYVGTDLLLQCLNEEHSQVAYQAEVAGLKYKLRTTRDGLLMTLGGYTDKMPAIASSVLEKVGSFKPSRGLFELVKDRSVRQLQSQLMQKAPYSQALDLCHQVVMSPYYTISEKLAQVLETKSESDLPSMHQVLGNSYMESLIEGNFDRSSAAALSQSVSKAVEGLSPIRPAKVCDVKVLSLKNENDAVGVTVQRRGVNPNETNGAVVVSVEAGWISGHVEESDESDLRTAALLAVTSQICGQKFFDDLRTKQQLGYIVHSAASVQERRAGLLFLVQSEVVTATVQDRIMEFINQFDSTVDMISSDDFQQYIEAVIADLLEKPKNQEEEFQRHWAEIEKRRFDFERKDRLIPIVQSISKDQLVEFVQKHVIQAPKITTIVTGANEPEAPAIMSDDEIRIYRESVNNWVHSYSKPLGCEVTSKM